MIEEGEGAIFGERDKPERELRHLDRHRILVHAVEAAFAHQAASQCQALFGVNWQQFLAWFALRELALWCDLRLSGVAAADVQRLLGIFPGFNQLLREVAAALHQERAR